MRTYENLFPQIIREIEKRSGKSVVTTDSRFSVQPGGEGGSLDSRALAEIVTSIASDLADLIEPRIISGFDVTATTPPSATVNISAGTGTSNGKKWEIEDDSTLIIPLDSTTYVFYITVYNNAFEISRSHDNTKCEICRIIVPQPGTTSAIEDDKPSDSYNGYIVSAKDAVYDEDQKFDDASVEKLRDVIGAVLADNLIGNIKLSENLKITNTQGTVELDSTSIKIKDINSATLAQFNRNGTFFYDPAGRLLAKFGRDEAYIGNILITKNSIQTRNFISGSSGFQIKDSGDVEFNDGTFRGTLNANIGNIGGWTLAADNMYATTTGTIKTSINAGAGANGVVLDKDGLRVYDAVLGQVVNLPSNGDAPTFSSGIINSTIFEINTNAVLRTAETVGDGSASSAGILINNTGVYGCGTNQLLSDANFKVLIDGSAYFKGEIQAATGQIGNVTITSTGLYGGLIVGSTLRGSVIETSATVPKVLIDNSGIFYQVSSATNTWGNFTWGDGTLWGAGYLATLFNSNFPAFAILAESTKADIRLYNRSTDPATGTHVIGDLIVTSANLKICDTAGSPGVFTALSKSGHTHSYAPDNATYICQTANRSLSAEQALSSLTTGIMYVTTTTGAITSLGNPLPIANGGTAAASAQAALNALAGAVTANRVLRGNGTNIVLAQVGLTTDVTGTLPVGNGGTGATAAANTANGAVILDSNGKLPLATSGIDSGAVAIDANATATITFNFAFSSAPLLFITLQSPSTPASDTILYISTPPTTTGAVVKLLNGINSSSVYWVAIGIKA